MRMVFARRRQCGHRVVERADAIREAHVDAVRTEVEPRFRRLHRFYTQGAVASDAFGEELVESIQLPLQAFDGVLREFLVGVVLIVALVAL